jgi:hypothetical protein
LGFLPWNFSRLFFLIFFWTVLPAALPSLPRLKPAFMPNRHPLSRVPAFASIALRQRLRRPSNRAYVPKKIPPWIFFGSEICKANLRGAKSPIHGLFNFYQVRKSLRGFFWDCRIATQFCMLLSRPSMGSLIFIKYEKSHTLKKKSTFFTHLCPIPNFYLLYIIWR